MRSRARRIAEFKVPSDWRRPTQGEQPDDGFRVLPALAEEDGGHELRRDDDQAEHRRDGDGADKAVDADPGDRSRSGSSWSRREGWVEEHADRPPDAAEQREHDVVRERVDAELAGAEDAADEEVVRVAVRVEEEPRAEHVQAEARETAEARAGEDGGAAATWRTARGGTSATVARIICCPMIAQAPNPAVASAIPAIPDAKVPSMIRSSRLRKFMSRVRSGALRGSERGHDERHGQRGQEGLHVRLAVEEASGQERRSRGACFHRRRSFTRRRSSGRPRRAPDAARAPSREPRSRRPARSPQRSITTAARPKSSGVRRRASVIATAVCHASP